MKLSLAHQLAVPDESRAPGLATAPTEPVFVLKFGSSVLRGLDDLPAIAGEIYRQRRLGRRIVAVVSALTGETDRLLAEADAVAGGLACAGVADLVSQGEERAAALLRIACDRIGLTATVCRPEELGLRAVGPALDADPTELRPGALLGKLEGTGLVIVPGFVGIGAGGDRALLGRGGSDLTAAILGGELGAACVRLYKDVDGVFDRDPNVEADARKFGEISHDDALRLARPLVHAKAVSYARQKGLTIQVATIGSEDPSYICGRTGPVAAWKSPPPVRVALAGYGVVGQALAARLKDDPRFALTVILVRDEDRPREVPPPIPLTRSPEALIGADCDVLVELLSCEETAAGIVCEKLRRGVDVVTASKRLVAAHDRRLRDSAAAGGAILLHSAAVGGSAPLLETIARARKAGPIVAVSAILNGTVNFVLQRLQLGIPLGEALAQARALGFAEEDSEADLSGADAAAKLKLAGAAAFDATPAEVEVTTERLDEALARRIAQSGERWIQHSSVRRTREGLFGRVALTPLAQTRLPPTQDEWNVALVTFADGAEITASGRGAGGAATAEAVLADLYDLTHRRRRDDRALPSAA